MDPLERIRDLALVLGLRLPSEPAPRVIAETRDPDPARCWVDAGIRCPYGNPDGQYKLRPVGFCHRERGLGDGCTVYTRHVVDPGLPQREKDEAVRAHFEANSTTLADVMGELAGRCEQRGAARLAFELAIVFISGNRTLDVCVMREDRLPEMPEEKSPR